MTKEYSEARKKARAQYRQLAAAERVPRVAYMFSSSSSQAEDTIDINGPAIPGLRELPLG